MTHPSKPVKAQQGEKAHQADIHARLLRGDIPEEAEIVSERILRRVLRVPTPEGVLFAKQHLFPFLRVRLRYALRSSPTRREAENLTRAAALGLLVPRVLAESSQRSPLGPTLAVLLTAALPEGRPLDPPARHRLFEAIWDLANKGVLHPDLHGDNLRLLEDGRVAFLDFQSCRFFPGKVPSRLLPSMLAPFLEEQLQFLPKSTLETWLLEKKISPTPCFAAVDRRGQKQRRTRERHALRNSTKVRRFRPAPLRHPFWIRYLQRGAILPQDYVSAGMTHLPPLGRCQLSQAPAEGGGTILRLRANRSLRSYWLRAILEGPDQGSRILAWDRNNSWLSPRDSLYILHQEGVMDFPMGGDDVASLLSRCSPPQSCS